jgi:putative transposase
MLEVSSKLMQQAVLDVWRAYRNFFAGRAGYPRFTSKKRDQPRFRFPPKVRIVDDRVYLPRIGWIRFRLSQTIRGEIRGITVKCHAERWFLHVLTAFELEDTPPVLRDPSGVVGVDLGVIRLAALSDGTVVEAPRFARRDARRLRRAERALYRTRRGGRNRQRQRRRLATLHRRVAARRKDFSHKLTTSLVATHAGVCVETLDPAALARTKLSRGVLDAGLGEVLRQLEYKSDWQRKPFVAVGRFFPSTKTCGECGAVNATLERSAREWRCACGVVHDRDLNAARNIRTEGLRLLAAAGHADAEYACGVQVRPQHGAPDVEAGTPETGMPNRFNLVSTGTSRREA